MFLYRKRHLCARHKQDLDILWNISSSPLTSQVGAKHCGYILTRWAEANLTHSSKPPLTYSSFFSTTFMFTKVCLMSNLDYKVSAEGPLWPLPSGSIFACTLKYLPCVNSNMVRMIQIQLVMTKYSSKWLLERNRYWCKVLNFTFNLSGLYLFFHVSSQFQYNKKILIPTVLTATFWLISSKILLKTEVLLEP